MTTKQLVIETIMKATGKDQAACIKLLLNTEQGRSILSGPDKELNDSEAEVYRDKFANEMSGILAWLVRETMISQPPKGSA